MSGSLLCVCRSFHSRFVARSTRAADYTCAQHTIPTHNKPVRKVCWGEKHQSRYYTRQGLKPAHSPTSRDRLLQGRVQLAGNLVHRTWSVLLSVSHHTKWHCCLHVRSVSLTLCIISMQDHELQHCHTYILNEQDAESIAYVVQEARKHTNPVLTQTSVRASTPPTVASRAPRCAEPPPVRLT